VKKIKKCEKKKLMWICVDLCGLLKKMSPALANVCHKKNEVRYKSHLITRKKRMGLNLFFSYLF